MQQKRHIFHAFHQYFYLIPFLDMKLNFLIFNNKLISLIIDVESAILLSTGYVVGMRVDLKPNHY